MPHYHYDTPKLSPRVKACRDNKKTSTGNSTAAAARQVCESTTAYGMETSSTEVEEVQSRTASVVHRNGQNMSAAQTSAAVPGSIASFFDRRAQTTSVPPGAGAFTAGPVDIAATASAAAVRTTVPVRAHVTATAPDAEAFTAELLVCGEPECEHQPCCAEPGQTTALSHPLLPAWSVAAKTCNCFYLTRYDHTQQDLFEITVITPHVITPLRYTTRGGE